jgi:hypothetical protein
MTQDKTLPSTYVVLHTYIHTVHTYIHNRKKKKKTHKYEYEYEYE